MQLWVYSTILPAAAKVFIPHVKFGGLLIITKDEVVSLLPSLFVMQAETEKEKKGKKRIEDYAGSKTLPASIKEKETH